MRHFAFSALAVLAMPIVVAAQLDTSSSDPTDGKIILAKITKTNGGGKIPKGNANGVPSTNPAGQQPPGQNKKTTGMP